MGWTRISQKKHATQSGVPTVNDDASAGYEVGSTIRDTDNNTTYYCTDKTTGAAKWEAREKQWPMVAGTDQIVGPGAPPGPFTLPFSEVFPIPANSLEVGDTIEFEKRVELTGLNGADTFQVEFMMGASLTLLDYDPASRVPPEANAVNDYITLRGKITVEGIGAAGAISYEMYADEVTTGGALVSNRIADKAVALDTTADCDLYAQVTFSSENIANIADNVLVEAKLNPVTE